MNINPDSGSKAQRDKQRIAELIAKAKADLVLKGLLTNVSPLLSTTNDVVPEIHKPNNSQANIEKQFETAKRIKQQEFAAEAQKLREAKEVELQAELDKIEASRVKMIWNAEQQSAIDMGLDGKSFCIIGKAGTGKTTVVKEVIRQVQASGRIGPMTESTNQLSSGAPGIAVVSFTNRAVKNIARGMPADVKGHTVTVHKLLEFRPVKMQIVTANGDLKDTMRFLPARNSLNPLPASLKLIIFEESSMISTELYGLLMDALPNECQMIFLGDLQQLPPVYGTAILGFKLLELPVIELTKIYRQAEGSPIIDFAWRIASGEQIGDEKNVEKSRKILNDLTTHYKKGVLIRPWKKRLDSFAALHIMNKLFIQFIDAVDAEGKPAPLYNEKEDMIMIPYNKSFGTIEFNKNLAQHLGRKRKAKVHEVIAGFTKHYFAIGDKVLVDRQEAIIEDININDMYKGVLPIHADVMLNRWGMYEKEGAGEHQTTEQDLEEVEKFLALTMSKQDGESEEAKQQASHVLVCRLLDSDEIKEVRTTGEYSSCIFAYALTVHKCQGSEWRKCFLILHHSHAAMLSRELLYTAVTRAREELYVICEPDAFVKGVRNQRIKGNSIAEKAEFFKGKLEREL